MSFATVAGVDEDAVHLGCVGVAFGSHHAGRDDSLDGRAHVDDLLDREAEVCHRRRERRRRRRPAARVR